MGCVILLLSHQFSHFQSAAKQSGGADNKCYLNILSSELKSLIFLKFFNEDEKEIEKDIADSLR